MAGPRGASPSLHAAHEAAVPARPGTRPSLGTSLVAIIVLQAVLFAALVLFAGDRSYRSALRQTAATSATTARTAADMIGRSVDDAAELVATEAARSDLAGVFRSAQSCALDGGRTGPFSSEMHIVAGDGTLRCTSLSPSGAIDRRAYADSTWLATVRRSAVATPVIAGPLVDPLTERDVVVIAARLASVDGAIVTTLDLASAADGLLSRLGGSAEQFFMITTADRRTVLAQTGRPTGGALDARFAQRLADGDPVVEGPDGVERIVGEATVESGTWQGVDWRVWAGVSTADALAGARDTFRTTVLFALAAMLIVLVAGWLIRRRVTQPVVKFARSVDEACDGDASLRIPTDGPLEVADLADRVNRLLDVRQGAEDALVKALRVERDANDKLRELDG
jgi:HAMP domain-containing protein